MSAPTHDQPPARRRDFARIAQLMTLAFAAVALTALIGYYLFQLGHWQAGSPRSGTSRLSLESVELEYPSDWEVNDQGWPTTGFGGPLAVIGTLPWGPCSRGDINCHYEQRLESGQITVDVGWAALVGEEDICERGATRSDLAGRGPNDPVATGSLTRIDGRPAIRTDYSVNQLDYYHSDEWREWLIASPGSTERGTTISAKYRGPGLEGLRAELDQIIASVRLGPSNGVNPGQVADCGPPFPP